MTPHKQLNLHRPDEGIIGDCWRTCIACLLDKRPEEVPHFCNLASNFNNTQHATANAKAYLATQGLSFIEYPMVGTLQECLNSVSVVNPDMYYMLGGNSANGVGHSVICLNDEIVWDPAQDNSGIVGPMDDGWYWISWLVPKWLHATTNPTRAGL